MTSYQEALKQKEKLEDIIRKECNSRKKKIEVIQNAAVQGLIGRYYSQIETGAEDDAFQIHRVIRRGWTESQVYVHSIGYWHKGHYYIKNTAWGYDVFRQLSTGYMKEITKEQYQSRLVDFLERVGDLPYLTFPGGSE